MQMEERLASCRCGRVQFRACGEPILTAVCYCDDCQAGGHQIEALPDAPPVLDEDHGSSYLIYRDDRIACVAGEKLLQGHRIRAGSRTQRFVASCCQSGMFVKFAPGHWKSIYRGRFSGPLPAIEMRSQTRFRKMQGGFPDSAPTHRRFPVALFGKLIRARLAMMFEL